MTIRIEVYESPVTKDFTLTVYESKWATNNSMLEIVEHESIHRESFETMDEALMRAVIVHYEYEQKGSDDE